MTPSLLFFLVLTFTALNSRADSLPGDPCSTANSIKWAGGPELQGVGFLLKCDSGTWGASVSVGTSGHVTFWNTVNFKSALSPAAVSGDVHNYNPAGLNGVSVLRISTSGTTRLTGLSGGTVGRSLILINRGPSNLRMIKTSPSSLASNRFVLPGHLNLTAKGSILLRWDEALNAWTALGWSSAQTEIEEWPVYPMGIAFPSGSVGIGASTLTSALTLTGTSSSFLPPRMSTAERDAMVDPVEGMMIYNTTSGLITVRNLGGWTELAPSAGSYEVFTTNGTWIKPTTLRDSQRVTVQVWGGGGIGGSFGHGGGGGFNSLTFFASQLPGTVSVVVSPGGSDSRFGNLLAATGGIGGGAGVVGGAGGGRAIPNGGAVAETGNAALFEGGAGSSCGGCNGGTSIYGGGGGSSGPGFSGSSVYGGGGGGANSFFGGSFGNPPGGGSDVEDVMGGRGEVRVIISP